MLRQSSILYKTISIVSYCLIRWFSESSKPPYTYRNNIIKYSRNISFDYPRYATFNLKREESWNPEDIANLLSEMKFLDSVWLVLFTLPHDLLSSERH